MKRIRGFSLLEMSIVLVIMGALLSIGVAANKMKRNYQVSLIVEDISKIQSAVTDFKKRYGGLPGDLWNATTQLGAGNTANGDGDKMIPITSGTENARAWQQLALAGFIQGNFDGTTYKPGDGILPGSITLSGYRFGWDATANAHFIYVAGFYDTDADGTVEWIATEYDIALLTPREAWTIDSERDDSNPTTGNIRGALGSGNTGNCISGGAYNLTNEEIACIMLFRLNE